MDPLIYLYAAVVVTAAALAAVAVWAPRVLSLKLVALVLAGVLMLTAHVSLVELLGRPKPVTLEWVMEATGEATVLGASMRENEAIYLWLAFDGDSEPRAYVVPWRLQTAKELQKATQQAQAEGTTVRMRRPFESTSDDSEPLFYAEPQPELPTKTSLAN